MFKGPGNFLQKYPLYGINNLEFSMTKSGNDILEAISVIIGYTEFTRGTLLDIS